MFIILLLQVTIWNNYVTRSLCKSMSLHNGGICHIVSQYHEDLRMFLGTLHQTKETALCDFSQIDPTLHCMFTAW